MHDALRDLRSRDDHDSINPARDRLQVAIARIALEGPYIGVHREDVVSVFLQVAIDQVAGRMMAVVV